MFIQANHIKDRTNEFSRHYLRTQVTYKEDKWKPTHTTETGFNIGRQDECSAKTSKVDVTNRWNSVASAAIDGLREGGQIARILTVRNLFETRQACRFISAVDRRRASRELNTLKPISVSATSTTRVASRLLPYKYTTTSVISPSHVFVYYEYSIILICTLAKQLSSSYKNSYHGMQ